MFPCIGTHSASKGYHLAVYLLLLHFLKKKKGEGGKEVLGYENSVLSNA